MLSRDRYLTKSERRKEGYWVCGKESTKKRERNGANAAKSGENADIDLYEN